MPTPSSDAESRSQAINILVFGHSGADPEGIAHVVGAAVGGGIHEPCDLAIFCINASEGIDQETIALWEGLNDSLVPRLIVVTGIESPEADFDDAVLLANRVFDQTVTPYLVLHDDLGVPCALIDLENLSILDYATSPPTISDSEPEHKTLVTEFRAEYLETLEIAGHDGFAAGVLFPALPIWLEKNIGVDILEKYVHKIIVAQSPSVG